MKAACRACQHWGQQTERPHLLDALSWQMDLCCGRMAKKLGARGGWGAGEEEGWNPECPAASAVPLTAQSLCSQAGHQLLEPLANCPVTRADRSPSGALGMQKDKRL